MAKSKAKSFGSLSFLGSKGASVVLRNLPFVLFLGFLTILYIANVHFAEKQVRRIQVLQREVKELKRQYNAVKSTLMTESQLSEVAADVQSLGLRKMPGRVKRIRVED